jgi:hypothetical protein
VFSVADPGSGMGKKIKIPIRDEHPGSYFQELRINFLGLKILTLSDVDPDPRSRIFFTLDPGLKNSGIWDPG